MVILSTNLFASFGDVVVIMPGGSLEDGFDWDNTKENYLGASRILSQSRVVKTGNRLFKTGIKPVIVCPNHSSNNLFCT